ncbi:MAG TPA: hypothetical protein VJN21_13620 [Candidatus Acidoferrales bacterium]|nr:hypothetical protein [Candidatus Acidoferrales bacterium]
MSSLHGPKASDRIIRREANLRSAQRRGVIADLSRSWKEIPPSRLTVGYCTLYGGMAGGLAVISDVPKLMVYELARHANRDREITPEATLTKPTSAELHPKPP